MGTTVLSAAGAPGSGGLDLHRLSPPMVTTALVAVLRVLAPPTAPGQERATASAGVRG